MRQLGPLSHLFYTIQNASFSEEWLKPALRTPVKLCQDEATRPVTHTHTHELVAGIEKRYLAAPVWRILPADANVYP